MKPFTRLLWLASLSLGLGHLVGAQIHLPFSRQVRDLSKVLVGRDNNPSVASWGHDYVFLVNATVGTPGQALSLVLSPSATDTWVPDASSGYCNYTVDYDYYYDYDLDKYVYNNTYGSLCLWGSFNKSLSSTYQLANQKYRDWSTRLPDATYADGTNFTDTLKLGSIELKDFPMGLADSSDQWIGVLGLGGNYSYYGAKYDNFPDLLVSQGRMASKAYSIWLDDEAGKSGNLLLGAVDTSKYSGTLTRIDGYASYALLGSFGVSVNGINGSSSSTAAMEAIKGNDLPFDASIGVGETFSNLPDALAKKIWSLAGASYNSTIDLATIACDAATKAADGGARFNFRLAGPDGPVLDVRLADLILPQSVAGKMWRAGYSNPYLPPTNRCLFAVQNGSTWGYSSSSSSSYGYYNLGSALLRRSYMVFDIANREVALAPVKFGSTAASAVVPFDTYYAPAPSATKYCGDTTHTTYSCDGEPSFSPGSSASNGTVLAANISLVAGLSVAFGLITLVALVGAVAVWHKLLCFGPRDKGAKTVEADPEQGGLEEIPGASPPVQQEMLQTSGHAPQLAPLPTRSSVTETQQTAVPRMGESRDVSPVSGDQPGNAQHEDSTVIGKGKGKETNVSDRAHE